VTAGKDRAVKTWEIGFEGLRQVAQLMGHETSVESLALSSKQLNKVGER